MGLYYRDVGCTWGEEHHVMDEVDVHDTSNPRYVTGWQIGQKYNKKDEG